MRYVFWCRQAFAAAQFTDPAPAAAAIDRDLFVAIGGALEIDRVGQWVRNCKWSAANAALPADDVDHAVPAIERARRFKPPGPLIKPFDKDRAFQRNRWLSLRGLRGCQ